MAESLCVVVDPGSMHVKAGFAGDDSPRACFSPCVGRLNCPPGGSSDLGRREWFIGDEHSFRGASNLVYSNPIDHGLIVNWDDGEKLLHHTIYSELRTTPEECSLLFLEPVMAPPAHREQLTTLAFETFNVERFSLQMNSKMDLFASGRFSGLAGIIGHEQAFLSAFVDMGDDGAGLKLPGWVETLNSTEPFAAPVELPVNGQALTEHLKELLTDRYSQLSRPNQLEYIRDIKEKKCFIKLKAAIDAGPDPTDEPGAYELPDGQFIVSSDTRYLLPEAMFQPSLIRGESVQPGLSEIVASYVRQFANCPDVPTTVPVVFSGASTLFPGFAARLQADVDKLVGQDLTSLGKKVIVIAPPERRISSWIGGSIFGSLGHVFSELSATKAEYDEVGPTVIHDKCPGGYRKFSGSFTKAARS